MGAACRREPVGLGRPPPRVGRPAGTAPSEAIPTEQFVPVECGDARVPIPLHPPTGWEGPVLGPAPEARAADSTAQLIVHWQGPAGAVEVRWPADPRYRFAEAATGDAIAVTEEYPVGTDGPIAVGDAVVPGAEGACAHLQITFYGSPPESYADRIVGIDPPLPGTEEYGQAYRSLVAMVTAPADASWIAGAEDVAELPVGALPCSGGEVPNRQGTVTTATVAASPDEAFTSWMGLPGSGGGVLNTGPGYLRLTAADGSVAFAKEFDGGDGYVGIVWLRPDADGWLVDRWETSGC